jgi:hypothetical protein
MNGGHHYRVVFDSPYLSAADVVDPITLTVSHVVQEQDKTKKTKDVFNTAYFVEREIRKGDMLKPMILNATNSKTLDKITGTPFIEGWSGARITIYVDANVKFGRDTVEGLRVRAAADRKTIGPEQPKAWENAKAAYLRDGNLNLVLSKVNMSEEHQAQLIAECAAPSQGGAE